MIGIGRFPKGSNRRRILSKPMDLRDSPIGPARCDDSADRMLARRSVLRRAKSEGWSQQTTQDVLEMLCLSHDC